MPRPESQEALVLDASVLINLLGSGRVELLLGAMQQPVMMAERTFQEVLSDPSGRMPGAEERQSLVDNRLICIESLGIPGRELFIDLVCEPDALDDGEAATIALAIERKAVPVLDDGKARRVFRSRFPESPLESTAGLLRRLNEHEQLPIEAIRDALFSALQNARMAIVAEEMDWAVRTLGTQLAAQCPSIRKSALVRR